MTVNHTAVSLQNNIKSLEEVNRTVHRNCSGGFVCVIRTILFAVAPRGPVWQRQRGGDRRALTLLMQLESGVCKGYLITVHTF